MKLIDVALLIGILSAALNTYTLAMRIRWQLPTWTPVGMLAIFSAIFAIVINLWVRHLS